MAVVENKESAGRLADQQALLGGGRASADSTDQAFTGIARAVILRDLQQLDCGNSTEPGSAGGTVKSRINRGRIELARILQQMG
jgi:hypothetical protein